MRKRSSFLQSGSMTILWGVLAIMLCGVSSLHAEDIDYAVTGPLFVSGTTNLLTGASVSDAIYVESTGILNMYSGSIGTNTIYADPEGTVNIYGTGLGIDGAGLVTGTYEDESSIYFTIYGSPSINLIDIGGGGGEENTPPVAAAGPDIVVSTKDIASTIIEGTATDPDTEDSLTYRWLEGTVEFTLSAPVGANGEAPLDLATILPQYLGIGTHILTLEVSDGQEIVSDEVILTIEVQQIEIDIKPDSENNVINLGSNGVIPVAILSAAGFDATALDPDSITLAGAGVAVRGKGNKYLASEKDVNGDGLVDLEVKIETENLDPGTFQDGTAILQVMDGETVIYMGSDTITIVPQ